MLNTRDYQEYFGSAYAERLAKSDYIYSEVIHGETIRSLDGKYRHMEMVTDDTRKTYLPVITKTKATKTEAFFIYGLLCLSRYLETHNDVWIDVKWVGSSDSSIDVNEDSKIEDILLYIILRYTELDIITDYEISACDVNGCGISIDATQITKHVDYQPFESIGYDSHKDVVSDVPVRLYKSLE